MRLRHLAWLVVLCAAWAGWAVTGSGQTSAMDRAVMQAIDQVNLAFQHRDVKTYQSLTTADFIRVASTGLVFGRNDWLEDSRCPGPERGPTNSIS